jgi:hypothetical protein
MSRTLTIGWPIGVLALSSQGPSSTRRYASFFASLIIAVARSVTARRSSRSPFPSFCSFITKWVASLGNVLGICWPISGSPLGAAFVVDFWGWGCLAVGAHGPKRTVQLLACTYPHPLGGLWLRFVNSERGGWWLLLIVAVMTVAGAAVYSSSCSIHPADPCPRSSRYLNASTCRTSSAVPRLSHAASSIT